MNYFLLSGRVAYTNPNDFILEIDNGYIVTIYYRDLLNSLYELENILKVAVKGKIEALDTGQIHLVATKLIFLDVKEEEE